MQILFADNSSMQRGHLRRPELVVAKQFVSSLNGSLPIAPNCYSVACRGARVMLTQIEQQLAHVNQAIAQLETEATRATLERDAASRANARESSRLKRLRFLVWFRTPAKSYNLWPLGVMLIGPSVAGVVTMICVLAASGSWATLLWSVAVAVPLTACVLASFLWSPSDTSLAVQVVKADVDARVASVRLKDAISKLTSISTKLRTYIANREQIVTSDQLKRAILLQRNWKAMRDAEWEDYLVEVCRAIGGQVERTAGVGDQGVDLVVQLGPRRIALQAKGYYHAVGNEAVQQVVAGMAYYQCNACAAITNSRFTPGAKELAVSNRCILIGEDEFPDFVLGKISI